MISCSKDNNIHATVLIEGAELHFRGFVTDEEQELVSQIHNFSRMITGKDTLHGIPVFSFISNDRQTYFYTDEEGTVRQYITEDIANRIRGYSLTIRRPIRISYWKIELKLNEGVGTEWDFSVDTTIVSSNLDGEKHRIRYVHNGKARYAGWSEAFIPESYKYERVVDAHWYELNTFIINQTTGDTLFASQGTAHQYFEPTLGAIKYITDYTKIELGQPPVALRGTWELMKKEILE